MKQGLRELPCSEKGEALIKVAVHTSRRWSQSLSSQDVALAFGCPNWF